MWLRFALVEFSSPREDAERMEKYLKQILSYDPNNVKDVLMLAYVQDFNYGYMTPETFATLNSLKTNDPEHLSMIEYAKAKYYKDRTYNENKNEKKYKECLEKSIAYYNKHVRNYEYLANYYFEKGEKQRAKGLLQKALDNIRHICGETYINKDITDIEKFLNYYYKGVHAMDWQRKEMKDLLKL